MESKLEADDAWKIAVSLCHSGYFTTNNNFF